MQYFILYFYKQYVLECCKTKGKELASHVQYPASVLSTEKKLL